jgi:3-phenylpropionate/trans-cinnamate dioxygenase ferredoxin subunit
VAEFHKLAPADELSPGEIRGYELEGRKVALCNVGGEFYAFENVCTHAYAILSEGGLQDGRVRCPLHGALFDVRTGEPKGLPAVKALPTHKVKVEDGTVYVALNEKRVKIGGGRRRR